MSEYPNCPICDSEEQCDDSCLVGKHMNEMRSRRIRVLVDNGEEYLNGIDIKNMLQTMLNLQAAVNGPMNQMTQFANQAIMSAGSAILAAMIPESSIRVLVSDIDTSVPDTVPSDWLNDAPGGTS